MEYTGGEYIYVDYVYILGLILRRLCLYLRADRLTRTYLYFFFIVMFAIITQFPLPLITFFSNHTVSFETQSTSVFCTLNSSREVLWRAFGKHCQYSGASCVLFTPCFIEKHFIQLGLLALVTLSTTSGFGFK